MCHTKCECHQCTWLRSDPMTRQMIPLRMERKECEHPWAATVWQENKVRCSKCDEILQPAKPSEIQSCRGKSGQVFCNDPNCGNRDGDSLHWPAGHPMNNPEFWTKD